MAVAPRTTPGVNQLLVVILTMEDIKKAIGEAEKELEVAERLVASKRSALMASVFLLGWLTFSFRSGPSCTVHQGGNTEANAKASNRTLSDFNAIQSFISALQ